MQSDTLIDNGPIIQFASSEGPTDGVSAIVARIGTSTLSSSPGFSRLDVLEHIRKRETLGEGMKIVRPLRMIAGRDVEFNLLVLTVPRYLSILKNQLRGSESLQLHDILIKILSKMYTT